jgi:hypothetical protein
VLHGRHDTILELAEGEALAAAIPGARLVVFEESGHAPFLEEPDAFNAALLALLTGAATSPARPAAAGAKKPAAAPKPPSAPAKVAKPEAAASAKKPAKAAKAKKASKPK